jgi:hypothetical protein
MEYGKIKPTSRLYKSCSYNLSQYEKYGLNNLEREQYFRGFKEFLENRKEIKYLGISIKGAYLIISFNKYRISSKEIDVLFNLEYHDLKYDILMEIKDLIFVENTME